MSNWRAGWVFRPRPVCVASERLKSRVSSAATTPRSILKCVAPDLSTLQTFLTSDLLTSPNVGSVKTSLVIRGAKDEPGVPFDVLEARLSEPE